MGKGLYFHIPFCLSKCPYCDFYSIQHSQDLEKNFVSALLRNIEANKGLVVDTIYFGGGTPSILSTDSFDRIFTSIYKNMKLETGAEITFEANPKSCTYNKLHALKSIGFNRISFGVQSANDDELKMLGRTHSYFDAKTSVLDAHKAGFTNISCDLMIGTPNQNSTSLLNSIQHLCSLPITHISAYILKIEQGTPFDCNDIKCIIADEDSVSDLYLLAVEKLIKNGYMQYEISNFAIKGYESRHNLKYWECDEYLGIGPSAHSYLNGKRYYTPNSLDKFVENDCQISVITDENPRTFEEMAMLRLRLNCGITKEICNEFGVDFGEIQNRARAFVKSNLVEVDNHGIRLTAQGFLLSNTLISKIIWE